jgi:Rrf2 family nitric oxide-sensitive transcriptional repressor
MKVVHGLAQGGFVQTFRGRGGGLTLAKDPKQIIIGAVVQYMEGPFKPVECFHTGHWCAIAGACDLPGMLDEAYRAFIAVLERYTLADILKRRRHLARSLLGPVRSRERGGRKVSRPGP